LVILLVLTGGFIHLYPFTTVEICRRRLHGANVAVLFYGQSRTLNRTHCSITEQVIAPLLNASHRVHVFVHGKLDGDSWQHKAYLDQVSKQGVRYHIAMQEVHSVATQCAMVLDDKYESRMRRLVKEGNTHAAELFTQLKYRESVNSFRKSSRRRRESRLTW